MHARSLRSLLAGALVAAVVVPASVNATTEGEVGKWNRLAMTALAQPPQVQVLHAAMVQVAVYDAVNAIVGGHQPYAYAGPAPADASVDAAVATAAHRVLTGVTIVPALTPAMIATLDAELAASLAAVPDGPAEAAGIDVGTAAANAMLAARAADGRYASSGGFPVLPGIGRWQPLASGNDPNAWVADVVPFVIEDPARFRTDGPLPLGSAAYAEEYNETKALGAASGSTRSLAQTDLALFYAVNPVEMFNRTFRGIAAGMGLSPADEARLFAQLNLSGADALISCWDDKRAWSFWRPLTAIQQGANDGNPRTAGDAAWQSFRPSPPYPEHPSGYNCLTGAMMDAARDFFGTDRVSFTMTANATLPPRSYARFTDVLKDTIDARIYLGFHFRTAEMQGAVMGKQVAHWVSRHALQPAD